MSWEAFAILYAVCSSFWVGRMLVHRASPTPKRFPTATAITATLVALGLILQLAFPPLLGWMQRNTGGIETGRLSQQPLGDGWVAPGSDAGGCGFFGSW